MNYTEPSVLFLDLGYKISQTSSWMDPVTGIFRTVELYHPVYGREIQLSGCNVCTKQNSSLLSAEIIVHSFIVLIYQSRCVDPQGYMISCMISSIGQEKHSTLLRWIYKHGLAVLYLFSLLTSLAKDIVTGFFPPPWVAILCCWELMYIKDLEFDCR